jgi:spore coat polysaccharide biosynthesis protein SpsF
MELHAIIQARMSSTRLPGKVLKIIDNQTILDHIITRLSKSKIITKIIINTSSDSSDDPIVKFALDKGIDYYRGSLNDVLNRYYNCAKKFNSKHIVRITADCPLIDAQLIDCASKIYFNELYDLYGLGGQFPDGLDFTIFNFNLLEKANSEASLNSEREHVCLYMEKTSNNQSAFKPFVNCEKIRFTVDQNEDILFLEKMLRINPNLFRLNSLELINCYNQIEVSDIANNNIIRNEGLLKSIRDDKI